MNTAVSHSQSRQEAFELSQKISHAFAHLLKRFGYETKAVADGNNITSTGRILTRVKQGATATFAFLAGRDALFNQVTLTQDLSNRFHGTIAAQTGSHLARDTFDKTAAVTYSPDADVVLNTFRQVSAPATVVAELIEDQLDFQQTVEDIKLEHDESGLIGPSTDLFNAFANSGKTHGVQVVAFDETGTATAFAHDARKVADLTASFKENTNFFARLIEPSKLVSVYGEVAPKQIVHTMSLPTPQPTRQPAPVPAPAYN